MPHVYFMEVIMTAQFNISDITHHYLNPQQTGRNTSLSSGVSRSYMYDCMWPNACSELYFVWLQRLNENNFQDHVAVLLMSDKTNI